jgi:hypothetical protein
MRLIRDISKIKKRRICILRISLSHLALWYNHTSLSIRNTSASMLTNQYGFFISLCDLLLALSVVFKPTLKSISLVCHQIDHSIFVTKELLNGLTQFSVVSDGKRRDLRGMVAHQYIDSLKFGRLKRSRVVLHYAS